MMSQPAIIEAIDIRKDYGMGEIVVHALDGVSLRIESGEFVAIMGPSGSGKSTLMNILGCLDRPTTGRYILNSEDVSTLNKVALAGIRNRLIGFVFQSYNLLPKTTAMENALLPLLYNKNHDAAGDRETRAREALRAVGLGSGFTINPKSFLVARTNGWQSPAP